MYTKQQRLVILLIFTTAFLVLDLVFAQLVTYPIALGIASPLFGSITEFVVKFFLCVAIPSYYIAHVRKMDPIRYFKLDVHIQKGLLTGMLIASGYIIGLFISHIIKGSIISFSIGPDNWINGIFVAGLFEEILFRGFLLQEFAALIGKISSTLSTSFIFALVHVPYIQSEGIGMQYYLSLLILFAFSIMLSYIFLKTKSLWSCALIHGMNNLASYILIS